MTQGIDVAGIVTAILAIIYFFVVILFCEIRVRGKLVWTGFYYQKKGGTDGVEKAEDQGRSS